MATELKLMKYDLVETKTDVKETKALVLELPQRILEQTDKRYVHSDTFEEFRTHLNTINKRQDSDIKWTKGKIVDVLVKVGTLVSVVGILLKAGGYI